jgi:hypothetical protein
MNIGLDAGGVIFIHDRTHTRGDTSQTEQFMPGCLEYVEKLAKDGHRIFVNSFAGRARGENTRKAIEQNMKEWIPKENVFVVGDRKDKWIICKEQKLQIMVDDRYDVLQTIDQKFRETGLQPPLLFWFSEEQRRGSKYVQVTTWEELYSNISRAYANSGLKK